MAENLRSGQSLFRTVLPLVIIIIIIISSSSSSSSGGGGGGGGGAVHLSYAVLSTGTFYLKEIK